MGMGFASTWLRQVSPPPASQNHFNHWYLRQNTTYSGMRVRRWTTACREDTQSVQADLPPSSRVYRRHCSVMRTG